MHLSTCAFDPGKLLNIGIEIQTYVKRKEKYKRKIAMTFYFATCCYSIETCEKKGLR